MCSGERELEGIRVVIQPLVYFIEVEANDSSIGLGRYRGRTECTLKLEVTGECTRIRTVDRAIRPPRHIIALEIIECKFAANRTVRALDDKRRWTI